jgi:aspartate aminotransferase
MKTSLCANKIKPSTTLAIAAKANAMRQEGVNVINFSAGEPDFNTPKNIIDAAISAAQNGMTRYTPASGTVGLRETIAKRIHEDLNLQYTSDEIIVSSGAKQSIAFALQAVLNPGDEVIIPAPYWLSYPAMVDVLNCTSKVINTSAKDNWKLTPEQLQKAISTKTKVLFLNSPSNPTGASYSKNELAKLGEVLKQNPQIIVISDDIYEKIYWGKEPFSNIITACPELKDRCILINGTSKAYAMTGWRIGYAAGNIDIIKAMSKLQSHLSGCACSVSQAAAQEAFSCNQDFLKENAQIFANRYKTSFEIINSIKALSCQPSSGAFYALIDATIIMQHKNIESDIQLAQELLEKSHIALVPGSVFGIENHLRLSFALDDNSLKTGLERLADYCQT